MIDHDRRLLFIHIARTGGTSVETALVGGDWWRVEPGSKHISAAQARVMYGENVWRDYTTFAIVRNPWDRLVSMWSTGWWWGPTTHLCGRRPASFDDFVASLEPHPHEFYRSLLYTEILNEPVDAVLRFERLAGDFADLLARQGCEPVALPHVERRARGDYRDYYSDASRDLVAERFRPDIEAYGYAF